MEQQSLDDSASADNMVSEYFKSTDETYCTHTHTHTQNPFKILLFIDDTPGHPRALMEIYETDVFLPANTTSIL